jgi:hypothetical protein
LFKVTERALATGPDTTGEHARHVHHHLVCRRERAGVRGKPMNASAAPGAVFWR